jgi:transposase-like protein
MRESAQSWRELLVDLKARGLTIAPELATGDGALGFWKALEEVSPTTRHQRCTVHKTVNVLDKLPKSVQPAAKADLREIWTAPDRATAEAAIASFAEKYGVKYEKAVTCLVRDRDALLTFYDFPAEHWDHLRTSNPVESVFATVRHRTVRTKGALSQETAKLMVFLPVYSFLRHRFAGRQPRGGGRWTRMLGRAWARRSALGTLAEPGPRPRRGGGCRRAASRMPCCGS